MGVIVKKKKFSVNVRSSKSESVKILIMVKV